MAAVVEHLFCPKSQTGYYCCLTANLQVSDRPGRRMYWLNMSDTLTDRQCVELCCCVATAYKYVSCCLISGFPQGAVQAEARCASPCQGTSCHLNGLWTGSSCDTNINKYFPQGFPARQHWAVTNRVCLASSWLNRKMNVLYPGFPDTQVLICYAIIWVWCVQFQSWSDQQKHAFN